MNKAFYLLSIALVCQGPLVAADVKVTLGLTEGERIAFIGDSLTDAGLWSHYFIAWLQLSYPELDLETINDPNTGSNLSQWMTVDTTPPAASTYERFVYPFEPGLVISMLGRNGGASAATHVANYTTLFDTWIEGVSGAKLLIVGEQPAQGGSTTSTRIPAEAEYADTEADVFHSDGFSSIAVRWASDNADNHIDIQQVGVTPLMGGLLRDAGHPGPAGGIASAYAILQGIGAESLVSSATINAAASTVTSEVQCDVSNVSMTATGGTFDRLDERLPWAIDPNGRANAIAMIPEVAGWQQYTTTITGLTTGTYTIAIDGEVVATKTAAQLAAGVNLADLTDGPIYDQCQEVLWEIRELHGFSRPNGDLDVQAGDVTAYRIACNASYNAGSNRGIAHKTAVADEIAGMAPYFAELHADAQPITRTYTITASAGGTVTATTVTATNLIVGTP